MLELVEREIRGRADHRPVAPAADHAGYLLVVRYVDGVVPVVEIRVDLGRHVHAPDLERRRHVALRDLRRHRLRMDHGVDVADVGRADGLGGATFRPFRRVRLHPLVRGALQHRGVFQLVAGEVLRPALHRFVAGAAEKAGHGEPLGEVLLVVPAVEVLLLVGGDVRPHHQECRTLLPGRHVR